MKLSSLAPAHITAHLIAGMAYFVFFLSHIMIVMGPAEAKERSTPLNGIYDHQRVLRLAAAGNIPNQLIFESCLRDPYGGEVLNQSCINVFYDHLGLEQSFSAESLETLALSAEEIAHLMDTQKWAAFRRNLAEQSRGIHPVTQGIALGGAGFSLGFLAQRNHYAQEYKELVKQVNSPKVRVAGRRILPQTHAQLANKAGQVHAAGRNAAIALAIAAIIAVGHEILVLILPPRPVNSHQGVSGAKVDDHTAKILSPQSPLISYDNRLAIEVDSVNESLHNLLWWVSAHSIFVDTLALPLTACLPDLTGNQDHECFTE